MKIGSRFLYLLIPGTSDILRDVKATYSLPRRQVRSCTDDAARCRCLSHHSSSAGAFVLAVLKVAVFGVAWNQQDGTRVAIRKRASGEYLSPIIDISPLS